MRSSITKLIKIPGIIFLFLGVVFQIVPARAANHINVSFGSDGVAVALTGYDTVAYFKEGRAVKGDAKYQTEWEGVKWYFSSSGNRDLFKSDPEKYAPQYGGNCAWAAAQGSLAHGNPIVWKIVDGKLYLNFNKPVQASWEKDAAGLIKKADANWPGLDK